MRAERKVLSGNPVSAGIAFAKAYVYYPLELKVTEGYFAAGEESSSEVDQLSHDKISTQMQDFADEALSDQENEDGVE